MKKDEKIKEKKPTLDEYLKDGIINQALYDMVNMIPKPKKKALVIEVLHRRIAKRGILHSAGLY